MDGLSMRGFFSVLFPLLLAGCAAVEGIFKAGLWVGIITVVIVIIVVALVARKIRR